MVVHGSGNCCESTFNESVFRRRERLDPFGGRYCRPRGCVSVVVDVSVV